MKPIFLLFAFLVFNTLNAQIDKKFEPVFIINDEIVSKTKVEEFAAKGYIKSMQNGASEEQFKALKSKYGDQILAKEFVMLIDIYTEEEVKARKAKKSIPKPDASKKKQEEGYLLNVGDQAIDFKVQMIDGDTLQLSDLKGKVVLLNWWASWCAPCIREFYEIPSKILDEFKEEDFVFLPIARGEDIDKATNKLASLKEKGIEFNSGVDPDETIWNQYASGSIPKNFIIDKEGNIIYVSTGNDGKSVDYIKAELDKIFKK
ncbi:MAG: TlpA disulfide reductase family protein [Bacteroidota bacterium]